MSSTICKAKNPEECRYHGTRSSNHTRMLKSKLLVAREVYKAATNHNEQVKAYFNLQEAETEYYSTDEGRESLITHINSSPDSDKRKHWLQILEKADRKREFLEAEKFSSNLTPVSSLNFDRMVKQEQAVKLAEGFYSNGTPYSFIYDEQRQRVFYEEADDMDSTRGLGFAANIEEAKKLASQWYDKQASR